MKIRGNFTINNVEYKAGEEVPWYKIYPFFLLHMLIFGISGFIMAYFAKNVPIPFFFFHGGFAIAIYTLFYIKIFGIDEVKWMFINAILSIVAMYTQIDWLLSIFGKSLKDYPLYKHIIPFLYYTLYTFLLRRAFIDLFYREEESTSNFAGKIYVLFSLGISVLTYFL